MQSMNSRSLLTRTLHFANEGHFELIRYLVREENRTPMVTHPFSPLLKTFDCTIQFFPVFSVLNYDSQKFSKIIKNAEELSRMNKFPKILGLFSLLSTFSLMLTSADWHLPPPALEINVINKFKKKKRW